MLQFVNVQTHQVRITSLCLNIFQIYFLNTVSEFVFKFLFCTSINCLAYKCVFTILEAYEMSNNKHIRTIILAFMYLC